MCVLATRLKWLNEHRNMCCDCEARTLAIGCDRRRNIVTIPDWHAGWADWRLHVAQTSKKYMIDHHHPFAPLHKICAAYCARIASHTRTPHCLIWCIYIYRIELLQKSFRVHRNARCPEALSCCPMLVCDPLKCHTQLLITSISTQIRIRAYGLSSGPFSSHASMQYSHSTIQGALCPSLIAIYICYILYIYIIYHIF